MNEYLGEETKIWIMNHPATAKKMLGAEDEAKKGEGDNQGDDREDGFGGSGHDNEDVSNYDDNSDSGSRQGQEMLGLKTPVYKSPMEKIGQKGVILVGLVRNTIWDF